MAIDLGDNPIGTPPTLDQAQQIKDVLGLGNVNNTSDDNKPISSDVENALNQKASIIGDNISNPSEFRENIGVPFIYAEDYGVVYTTSDDTTATANAIALTNAFAASASLGRTLIIRGTVYAKGQISLSGVGIRVLGQGAQIIQKDIAHNGVVIPEVGGAFDLVWEAVDITGQGSATHAAAAFYAKRGDLAYLTSDITIRDSTFKNFRYGFDVAGIAKFRCENVSTTGCRVDHKWHHMQTSLLTNCRGSQGDGHADSACFELTGGNFFGSMIIGGEWGGFGKVRFANIIEGMLHVEDANLEAFTSPQTINKAGLGSVSIVLRRCRIANTYTGTTSALISAEVNGNVGIPVIEMAGTGGWAGTPRIIEIYGTHSTGGGAVLRDGEPQLVTYAATQGGAVSRAVIVRPGARDYSVSSSFPVSTALPGFEIQYSPIAFNSDDWATNPLFRYVNNHTGTNAWSSQLNDMLMRVLSVNGRVASANNIETDIHNFSLPVGVLRNGGESVEIEIFGSTAANANNKQFKFYFGGTQYFDFGSLPINGESWTLRIKIQRGAFAGGTGYMKLVGILEYGSGRVIRTAETPNATIDSTATIATRVTVLTPSAANDAVSLAAKTTWLRAPSVI